MLREDLEQSQPQTINFIMLCGKTVLKTLHLKYFVIVKQKNLMRKRGILLSSIRVMNGDSTQPEAICELKTLSFSSFFFSPSRNWRDSGPQAPRRDKGFGSLARQRTPFDYFLGKVISMICYRFSVVKNEFSVLKSEDSVVKPDNLVLKSEFSVLKSEDEGKS